MYEREIEALPLSYEVKHKLLSQGCRLFSDISKLSAQSLTEDLGLDASGVVEVLNVTSQGVVDLESISALCLLNREQLADRQLRTGCYELDDLLGGGVPLGRVIEFCGGPGIGKTQFGMQLCVGACLGESGGGCGYHAVYIDTEGSFSTDRVVEMCRRKLDDARRVSRSTPSATRISIDEALSRIHYFRVHSYMDQAATFRSLPEFVRKVSDVRLIIVDSISMHFRQGFEDMSFRTRLLNQLAQEMMGLAEANDIAVVYMNQVTKRVYLNNESETVPVLGDSWSQCVSAQVRLYWNGSVRHAGTYKAPNLEQKAVPYQITTSGIQSMLYPQAWQYPLEMLLGENCSFCVEQRREAV